MHNPNTDVRIEHIAQKTANLRTITVPESADAVTAWVDHIADLTRNDALQCRLEAIPSDVDDVEHLVAVAFGCPDPVADDTDDTQPWHYSGRWVRLRIGRIYDEHANEDHLVLPHPVEAIRHACSALGRPVPDQVGPLNHEFPQVVPSPQASTSQQLHALRDTLVGPHTHPLITGFPSVEHLQRYAADDRPRAAQWFLRIPSRTRTRSLPPTTQKRASLVITSPSASAAAAPPEPHERRRHSP